MTGLSFRQWHAMSVNLLDKFAAEDGGIRACVTTPSIDNSVQYVIPNADAYLSSYVSHTWLPADTL